MPDTDSTTNETWKPVVGYDGFYDVSNLGRVRRIAPYRAGRYGNFHRKAHGVLKPLKHRQGYQWIMLHRDGKHKHALIHSLVVGAFIGPMPSGKQTNHIDTDKSNNRLDNLEYVTPSRNSTHASERGLLVHTKRKLNAGSAEMIREMKAEGIPVGLISEVFGVSVSTVYDTVRGRRWKHVPHG